jgi:chromosome segregation ATPase
VSKQFQIAMLIRIADLLRGPFTCVVLLSMHLFAFPSTSLAQNEGLTFEQAQTRTTYAREKMQASRLKLNEAEASEDEALSELAELQKRLEQARKNADLATQERQKAEEGHQEAKDRWAWESERLKEIHQRRIRNSPSR